MRTIPKQEKISISGRTEDGKANVSKNVSIDGRIRYGYMFGKTYEKALDKLTLVASNETISPSKSSLTFASVSSE